MKHAVGSPRWNRAKREQARRDAIQRERIERVLRKARQYSAPVPTAVAVTEMKMPGARVLEGYASVFDLPDYQGDIVAVGAFDEWLSTYDGDKSPIPLLLEHRSGDKDALRGWAETLIADDHGLWARFSLLPDHGEDVLAKVRSGALSGLSIGYVVEDDREPTFLETEMGAKRVLTRIHVREVSLVRTPANTASRAYSVKTRTQMLLSEVRTALAVQRGSDVMDADATAALSRRVGRVLAAC
jgi:HK97 family phage prohead protease